MRYAKCFVIEFSYLSWLNSLTTDEFERMIPYHFVPWADHTREPHLLPPESERRIVLTDAD